MCTRTLFLVVILALTMHSATAQFRSVHTAASPDLPHLSGAATIDRTGIAELGPEFQLVVSGSGGAIMWDGDVLKEAFENRTVPSYGGSLALRYIPTSRSFGISAELGLAYLADATFHSHLTTDQMYDPGYVEYEIFYRDHELRFSTVPISIGLKWTQNQFDAVSFWVGASMTTASMSLAQSGWYNITSGFDTGIADHPVDESVSSSGSGWRLQLGSDIRLAPGLSATIHGYYGAVEYERSETLQEFHDPVIVTDFQYVDNYYIYGRSFKNPGADVTMWGIGAGVSYVIDL